MKKYGWLVWTKERSWRFYMPSLSGERMSEQHITFGSNQMPIPITNQSIQPGELGFPVHLRVSRRGTWRLSPLIGIVTSKQLNKPGFRGNKENFRDIIETGRRMGVPVFVFTPDDINEKSAYTLGFTRHPAFSRWIRLVFPRPHVVYNRIPDREAEQRQPEQQTLRFLQSHPDIELFNPHFFNKRELFRWFTRDRALKSFVPRTESWGSQERFSQFLQRFETLYIKPAQGKAGKGIMQIKKEGGGYRLTYVTGKASELKHYRTNHLETLYKKINSLTKERPYLLQQGVHLVRYQGRPFDLRMLVQKNGSGRWDVTGLGIRVAGANGITTHVPRGGSIGKPGDIFPRVFASRAKDVYKRALDLAVLAAEGIERQSGLHLGEISIDLGIDRDLNMWLFEANAKPMKFDEPLIRKRSLERIIEYATFLAEGREPGGHP